MFLVLYKVVWTPRRQKGRPRKVIYDTLARELAARGNSYAEYLQAGRPHQHWQVQMPSGLSGGTVIDIGGLPRVTPTPTPVTQQPVTGPQPATQPVFAEPQPAARPTAPLVNQPAPAALADQLASSGQQPVWQQTNDRGPDSPNGLVFQRTSHRPEGLEVAAPPPPVQPAPTDEDGLVATQPMAVADLPSRRRLGNAPLTMEGWAAQTPPPHPQVTTPANVEDSAPLPPMAPAASPRPQSPMDHGAQVWRGITQQDW